MKLFSQKLKYFIVPATYILAGIISYGDHFHILPLTLIACFLTAYFLKENIRRQMLWALLPLWLLILIPSLIDLDFKRSLLYLIFIPISALLGRWAKTSYFAPKFALTILLSTFLGKFGYPSVFLALTDDSKFYDTKPFPKKLIFTDKHKDTIQFQNKITVLDFWNTSCKPCYEKFPYYEKISKKYQHPEIAFYSVNVPLKNQSFEERTKAEEKLGYSYKTIYSEALKKVQKSLGFNSYPHLIILNDSTIIYSGNFVTGESIYIDNLDRQLQKITQKNSLQL
ncbi:TlpA disulfide reductase family protein [Muricauda sp. 334s03]|uniref:TlpA disulfide reductase family protein n=1 Tax=Flagellimonas yonaguniensis TaxID=3031325 RepID=A0ABT5Y3G1_9FLAO|nr:TlpA disulfide reductase family protein [[Muricauda] yonaguniensis]MDF0717995.1 TlpA disulfide reductase family protein [[Muricauda] yonaguniensis]